MKEHCIMGIKVVNKNQLFFNFDFIGYLVGAILKT